MFSHHSLLLQNRCGSYKVLLYLILEKRIWQMDLRRISKSFYKKDLRSGFQIFGKRIWGSDLQILFKGSVQPWNLSFWSIWAIKSFILTWSAQVRTFSSFSDFLKFRSLFFLCLFWFPELGLFFQMEKFYQKSFG